MRSIVLHVSDGFALPVMEGSTLSGLCEYAALRTQQVHLKPFAQSNPHLSNKPLPFCQCPLMLLAMGTFCIS